MNFFTDKGFWSKIIILLIVIILFQFVMIRPVAADDTMDFKPALEAQEQNSEANKSTRENAKKVMGLGGKLLEPILQLLLILGDGIVSILHRTIMGQERASIYIDVRK